MKEVESWDKSFSHIAKMFANHSSCVKRKVGAILVKDLRIISIGYNGTPSGFVNCDDVFTHSNEDGIVKGKGIHNVKIMNHHEFSERYEIHAEQNCIAFAAKNGISTDGCTLYTTTAPCAQCAKLIIASGIKRVVYYDVYKNSFGLELLEENGVKCERV